MIAKHDEPIYEIMLMSKDGSETIKGASGEDLGWPDCGTTDYPGYYHDLDDAMNSMHSNNADLRECVFCAGFIIKRYPGLYQTCNKEDRIYFKWCDEKNGFFEADEPPTFDHIII